MRVLVAETAQSEVMGTYKLGVRSVGAAEVRMGGFRALFESAADVTFSELVPVSVSEAKRVQGVVHPHCEVEFRRGNKWEESNEVSRMRFLRHFL
jgi:hypothetical protein